jgi:DNA polymerase III subunit gamma/tau
MTTAIAQSLAERYRPTTYAEVCGQDKVIAVLERLKARYGTLAGRAYWISGQSGTGKTTLARLIAAEVADNIFTQEVDGTTLGVNDIGQLVDSMRYTAWGRGGKAVIINEAHGLSKAAIRTLLVAIEPIQSHVVWCFTTTNDGQDRLFENCDDGGPLLSRCYPLALSRRDLSAAFAKRALEIAEAEGIGVTIERCVALCKQHRNNMRAVLMALEMEG